MNYKWLPATPLLLLVLLHISTGYDCYSDRCYDSTYSSWIFCNQRYASCNTTSMGQPVCESGQPGRGVTCDCPIYKCISDDLTGEGVCLCMRQSDISLSIIVGVLIAIGVMLMFICFASRLMRMSRERSASDDVVVNAGAVDNSGDHQIYHATPPPLYTEGVMSTPPSYSDAIKDFSQDPASARQSADSTTCASSSSTNIVLRHNNVVPGILAANADPHGEELPPSYSSNCVSRINGMSEVMGSD